MEYFFLLVLLLSNKRRKSVIYKYEVEMSENNPEKMQG